MTIHLISQYSECWSPLLLAASWQRQASCSGMFIARPHRDNQQFTQTQTYVHFGVDQPIQRSSIQTAERRDCSVCTISLRSIPVRELLVWMDLWRTLVGQHQHQATLLNRTGQDGETLGDVTVGWVGGCRQWTP